MVGQKQKQRYLPLAGAVTYLGNMGIHRTITTLREWCKKHHIGHQVGKVWMVDVDKLDAFIAPPTEDARD